MGRVKLKSFSKDDNYSIIPHSARGMGKDRDCLVIYWYLSQDAAFGVRFQRKELGGQEVAVELQPGEVLTTMRGLAAEAGVSQKTAWRKVKLLLESGYIESVRQLDRYFSIIKLARPERGKRHDNQEAREPVPQPILTGYKDDGWDTHDPAAAPEKCKAGCTDYEFDPELGHWCTRHDEDPVAWADLGSLPCERTPEEIEAEKAEEEEAQRIREDILENCVPCKWGTKDERFVGAVNCEKLDGKRVWDRKRECRLLGIIDLSAPSSDGPKIKQKENPIPLKLTDDEEEPF